MDEMNGSRLFFDPFIPSIPLIVLILDYQPLLFGSNHVDFGGMISPIRIRAEVVHRGRNTKRTFADPHPPFFDSAVPSPRRKTLLVSERRRSYSGQAHNPANTYISR